MGSSYRVERHRHVDAPAATVRERIVDLRRWPSWSPWEGLDPDLDRTYGGPDAGPGAWYAWEGNRKAGKGRMEIIEATDGHVEIDLRFDRPFSSRSRTRFDLVPDGGGTRVTWSMTGDANLLMRVIGIVWPMDRMIGPDFERGLAALKTESEAADGAA